jgi:hypothetical protein
VQHGEQSHKQIDDILVIGVKTSSEQA